MNAAHKPGWVAQSIILSLAPCAVLFAPRGNAADHLNIKPGLWEVKSVVQTGGTPPIPKSVLDQMTPEQRAKIVAAAQANASKPRQTVSKECITQKEIEEPFQTSSMKECKQTIVSTTRTTQEVRMVCNGDPKGAGVMKITTPTPESMAGIMDLKMGEGADTFTVKATLSGSWLGADCGDEADDAEDAGQDEGPADDNEEEE